MKVVPILGPHFAGKTTLWRSLLSLPAPPAKLVEEEVEKLGHVEKLLPNRVMNRASVTHRGVFYCRTLNRGVIFPIGLWDGGVSHPDDLMMHLTGMAAFGSVLIDGPTRNLVPLMVRRPFPAGFEWGTVFALDPPDEVVIQRAETRRAAGLGRNANPERMKKSPESLALAGIAHWRKLRTDLVLAGFSVVDLYPLSREAVLETIGRAL